MVDPEPLLCPSCATRHSLDVSLCPNCGQPLVYHGDGNERQLGDGEVNPQYSSGDLVKVGWGRNQPQAEFVQNLLIEHGIPSILRRSAGFDVPDFLAAGPRDVMVPQSGAEAAREVLTEAELYAHDSAAAGGQNFNFKFTLMAICLGFVLLALIVWLIFGLASR